MVWRAVLIEKMRSVLLAHSLRIGIRCGFLGGDCVMVRDAQCERRLLQLDASDGDAGLRGESEAQSFGFGDGGREVAVG